MLTIGFPKKSDFKAVLALIKEFQAEGIDDYGLFCDDAKALEIMPKYLSTSMVMENDGELIGVVAGLVVNYPLSDQKVFQEQLWYVKKAYRRYSIKLFNAIEDFCKDTLGVSYIVMCSFGQKDGMGVFYERNKYKRLETHYIKTIGG